MKIRDAINTADVMEVEAFNPQRLQLVVNDSNDQALFYLNRVGAEQLATALIEFLRNHPDVKPDVELEG